MSNLDQAAAMASLACSAPPESRRVRTAEQVTEAIFADAAQRKHDPFIHIEPESWRKRWLASSKFYLMRVPIACVALPCTPRDMNWMLGRINAESDAPIVVDVNKPGVGRTKSGHVPPITVVDGKHRFAGASMRGATHIWAWVGELAAERIRERPAIAAAKWGMRNHGRTPRTNLDRAVALSAEGIDSVEAAEQVLARDLKADPTVVRRLVAQFNAIHGKYHVGGAIRAVSPPGWGPTVERMKEKMPADKAVKLAWWMHQQGHRPHKGGD